MTRVRSSYARARLNEIRDARWGLSSNPVRPRALQRGVRSPLDADYWTPPSVELLPISELLLLPAIGRNACRAGVYFLFLGGEVQYIGSSRNVRTRALEHDFFQVHDFDKATYLAIPDPWQTSIEALYIERYAPPRNANLRPRNPSNKSE